MNRVELKESAKRQLQGKYKDAIILILLMTLISYAATFVGGLLGVLAPVVALVVSGLIGFGYTSYFLKISRGETPTYKELFARTDLLVPYILITLLVGVFTFLWSLLLIIPGIIASFAYSMVYFVALDHPELSASEVLKKSKQIMDGHKLDYFILILSFTGWIILALFTFGLLYLWLLPYMEVTYANFYNQIKDKSN